MNLAILVVDYETYTFEGGQLAFYSPCEACGSDSLPFIKRYNPPLDFGDVAFIYSETGDTLFHATIIWMGDGQIQIPQAFLPPDSFQTTGQVVQDPAAFDYFSLDTTYRLKADSAWLAVRDMDIVEVFSENVYQVGLYLYPPTVGAFDPGPAKWIVFLHQDLININIGFIDSAIQPEGYVLSQNYPNPFNPVTIFRYTIPEFTQVRLNIFDLLGQEVITLVNGGQPAGSYTVSWNASIVPGGIYFYRLAAGDRVFTRKLLVLK